MQQHTHEIKDSSDGVAFAPAKGFSYGSTNRFVVGTGSWEENQWNVLQVGNAKDARIGNTTHGKRKGVVYLIKVL